MKLENRYINQEINQENNQEVRDKVAEKEVDKEVDKEVNIKEKLEDRVNQEFVWVAREIVAVGKSMVDEGLVVANDGNISVRVDLARVLATPTGVSKGRLTEEGLVTVDLTGRVLAGYLKPSSELKMHLKIYEENPEVRAVVHGHPPIATAFGVAGIPLDQGLLTEAVVSLGVIPVAKYGAPSTQELADSIICLPQKYNGAILANHGVVAWGSNLEEAFFRLERIEYLAKITLMTNFVLGKANLLGEGQIDHLLTLRTQAGITAGGRPVGVDEPTNLQTVLPAVK